MAANKFASMLHKNCHRIMVILIYALLEWILILLLLLNSFFSYLIAKFSNFFGLKPSCTWCSKLDHVFDTQNIANSHFDHVCEAHGAEISKLSYCSNHKRLAESQKLCSNCSSSSPQTTDEISSTVAFLSEGVSDTGKENRCSCCDEIFSRKMHPTSLIFKPSWDVLDCIHKRASLSHEDLMKHIEFGGKGRENDYEDQLNSDGGPKREVVEVQEWDSSQNDDPFWRTGCNEDDESVYLADMLLQNADYTDSDRFICIELIDTPSVSSSQQPLTNSSEDVEDEQRLSVEEAYDESNRRCQVQESSDVDTTESFPESEEKKDYKEPNNAITGLHEEQESSNQGHKDCLDGSLVSEMEVDDLSREDLKSIIRDQEKALKALYTELEEERKAAEEAAKETMAMITKVQEEKAAIQIEALQYQRMMEEQAEYDQEALQLLNDLMMKREKEKKELEKELETYMNKFMDYEAKENDDHSVDLDSEDDCLEETGDECVRDSMIPDVSLTEFDEERVSILDEVKVLEAKLLALHNEDDERESEDHIAKKLLPLFDDHERETTTQNGVESNSSKILIQEELGYVYERLQALEEDKDFLEHCIRSMMKGNKGLYLLQEILQHLRDLKSVELSARNLAQIRSSDASVLVEDQE